MRERNEIELRYRWALEDLYPSDAAWEEDLKKLTALVECFSAAMGFLLAMVASGCVMVLIGTVCFMKGMN